MFYFGLFSKSVPNDGAQEEVNGEEQAVDGGDFGALGLDDETTTKGTCSADCTDCTRNIFFA